MTVIYEGPNKFYIGAQCSIIEDGRELAWAERYVTKQDDIKWILGNFVEADNANGNGHIFPLDDIRTARASIEHKPLNFLHHPHQVVGCFAGQELLEPTGEHAGAGVINPHVEALAAYWHYYFQDLYDKIVLQAHREGTLYYSMEAVPKTLTCVGGGGVPQGCGREFAYMGRTHDTYCDHLNAPGSRKRLNKPHFTAGALIVPPIKPGWKDAHSLELSSLIKTHAEEAEMAYDQFTQEFPHLEPKQWEDMMLRTLADAEHINVDVRSGKTSPAKIENTPTGATSYGDQVRNGNSLPDGTWMIITESDLLTAIEQAKLNAIGIEEIREHIMRRAKALGRFDAIPAEWKTAYPDWERESDSLIAGFGHGDYPLEYELARDFSTEKRRQLAKTGKAIPDDKSGGRFPVVTVADLKNAIKLARTAGERAFVKKRAAALGATSLIPDDWT